MLTLFITGDIALKQIAVHSQQSLLASGPAHAYQAFTPCTQFQTQDQILSHHDTAYIWDTKPWWKCSQGLYKTPGGRVRDGGWG